MTTPKDNSSNQIKKNHTPSVQLELDELWQIDAVFGRRFHQIGHLRLTLSIGHVDPGFVVILLI